MSRRPRNSGNLVKNASFCRSASPGGSSIPNAFTASFTRYNQNDSRANRRSSSHVKNTARADRSIRYSAHGPVQPLLQMLLRISPLEPRIKHPVRKHKSGSLRPAPRPAMSQTRGTATTRATTRRQTRPAARADTPSTPAHTGKRPLSPAPTRARETAASPAIPRPARRWSRPPSRARLAPTPRRSCRHGFRHPARSRVHRSCDL